MIRIFSFSKLVFKYLFFSAFVFLLGVILFYIFPVFSSLIIFSSLVSLPLILAMFRTPERYCEYKQNTIYSPCDGQVYRIKIIQPDEKIYPYSKQVLCISIKCNILNSFIRTAPTSGEIESSISTIKERFFLKTIGFKIHDVKFIHRLRNLEGQQIVWFDGYSDLSIFNFYFNDSDYQISTDDYIYAGKNIGFVMFANNVQLLLPENFHEKVVVGQTVIAGETEIASKSLELTNNDINIEEEKSEETNLEEDQGYKKQENLDTKNQKDDWENQN